MQRLESFPTMSCPVQPLDFYTQSLNEKTVSRSKSRSQLFKTLSIFSHRTWVELSHSPLGGTIS